MQPEYCDCDGFCTGECKDRKIARLTKRAEKADEAIVYFESMLVRLMELCGHDVSDKNISDAEEVITERIQELEQEKIDFENKLLFGFLFIS